MVSKSLPEIDIREAIGRHQFSVIPRSLVCKWWDYVSLLNEKRTHEYSGEDWRITWHFKGWRQRCLLSSFHGDSCYHRLVFDRYDLRSSLKSATRAQMQVTTDPVYYHITDSTQIAKANMKRLLSHSNTKMELTVYLVQKSVEYAVQNGGRFVVSWACQCEAAHQRTEYLQSNQEEADTKLLLHALDASANGATILTIHSLDTDVFVLSLRCFPELCQNTYFVTGTGQRHKDEG